MATDCAADGFDHTRFILHALVINALVELFARIARAQARSFVDSASNVVALPIDALPGVRWGGRRDALAPTAIHLARGGGVRTVSVTTKLMILAPADDPHPDSGEKEKKKWLCSHLHCGDYIVLEPVEGWLQRVVFCCLRPIVRSCSH